MQCKTLGKHLIHYLIYHICKNSGFCVVKTEPKLNDEEFKAAISSFRKNCKFEYNLYNIVELLYKIHRKQIYDKETIIQLIHLLKTYKLTYSEKFPKPDVIKRLQKQLYSIAQKIDSSSKEGEVDIQKLAQHKLKPEYMQLKQDLVKKLKYAIQYLFHKYKWKYISIQTLNRELRKLGYPPVLVDTNLICIDAQLKLYVCKTKKELDCNIPLIHVEIEINKDYNPEKDDSYVLKFRPIGGKSWQFCYTKDYKKRVVKGYTEKLKYLLKNIEKYRRRWLKDLESKDPIIKQMALATELLYQTAARIGTETKDTFGLVTILRKHIKCDNKKCVIRYPGKKGIIQTHIIDDPKLVKYLKELIKNKKPSERVFTFKAQKLNDYLRKRIGLPITAHKFRHLKGSAIAYKYLFEENPYKNIDDPKVHLKYFKQVMLDVGKTLGHINNEKPTWTTAVKYYVDPHLILDYFEKYNIPLPKSMQKLLMFKECIEVREYERSIIKT